MANITRKRTTQTFEEAQKVIEERSAHRTCIYDLEQMGYGDKFNSATQRYEPPGLPPKVGDVIECEHGRILLVTRTLYRRNEVEELTRGPKYKRAVRALKRERREKVLAERAAAAPQDSSRDALSTAVFGFPGLLRKK